MARIKHGVTAQRKHKQVLAMTKGHRGTRHNLYRRAHESMLHALQYAYEHRRERKGDFRRLWIVRIAAAARQHGLSYSQFIHGLKLANVSLDRKIMAHLASKETGAFGELAGVARAQLTSASASS